MLIRKAYSYVTRERPPQARAFTSAAGCCRFVWNRALALQNRYYRRFGKYLGYNRLAGLLPAWKRRFPFIREAAPSQALQQTLRDLDAAWQRHFKDPFRVGRPRFKKRGKHDAFRLPQGVELDATNSRLRLSKLGWVRLRLSRPVIGAIKNTTVSLSGGRWRVSLQVEFEEQVRPRIGTAESLDFGVTTTATTSSGAKYELEARLEREAGKLKYLQRCLSRKDKGSQRYNRAKRRLSKRHTRVIAVRNDALHKMTTGLVKEHAVLCLEALNVVAMTAATSKAKADLNRRILNASWGEARRQIEYKAAWTGAQVVAVPPTYTSQTCACCAHVAAANRRGKLFSCQACGHTADADVNAAVNIRRRGLELLRAGSARSTGGQPAYGRGGSGDVSPPVKRQPTEALSSAVGIPVL